MTTPPFEVIEAISQLYGIAPASFFPGYEIHESLSGDNQPVFEILTSVLQLGEERLKMMRFISSAMVTKQKRISNEPPEDETEEPQSLNHPLSENSTD